MPVRKCRVEACGYEAIDYADLDNHMKKRHPGVAIPKKETRNEGRSEERREDKPRGQGGPNFIPEFRNKNVIAEFVSGKTITGKLVGWNSYELLIEVGGKRVVAFKHALTTIEEAGEGMVEISQAQQTQTQAEA